MSVRHPQRTYALIALLVALQVLGPTEGAPGSQPPPPPQKQSFFNDPTLNTVDPDAYTPITDRLVELINDASPSAIIRIAMYAISGGGGSEADKILDALEAAVASPRNVDVRAVVESDTASTSAALRLRTIAGAEWYVCNDGCYAPGADLHSKFMLVSNTTWTSGSEEVVAIMSANWNDAQLRHRYNNLTVTWSDSALYAAMRDHFGPAGASDTMSWCAERSDGDCNPPRYVSPSVFGGSTGTDVHVFPKNAASTGDTIVDIINAIGCPATIRVSMALWSNSGRGRDVADALASKTLCTKVILIDSDAEIRTYLKQLNLAPLCLQNQHSKYLLVDGTYGGTVQQIVWTGSHNYTHPALHDNDEVLLKVRSRPGGTDSWNTTNQAVFQAYVSDHDVQVSRATPC